LSEPELSALTLHGLGLLLGRLRERNKFEAALHDKEMKSNSYADEEQIADFFERLAKKSR